MDAVPLFSRAQPLRVIGALLSLAVGALATGALATGGLATRAHAQSASTAAATPQPSGAGQVRLLVKSADGMPLVGAQVRVAGGTALFESDERGMLTMSRLPAAATWLRVRRIGYRPDSVQVTPQDRQPIDVTIALERVAVDLAAVRVMGRREIQGPMAGFYKRRATGSGRFFTHAEIDKRNPALMTDLLRGIPGVRIDSRLQGNDVRIRGSRCAPLVWLDGQGLFASDIDLDGLDPLTFEGIEIYSTASVPVEFLGGQRASSSCGTIVLWTRLGEARPRRTPTRSRGELSPAAQVAAMLEQLKIFTADDVDVVAHVDSLNLVRPVYPDALFDEQVPGRLLAEFIVGIDGTVIIETFSAVTTTHAELVDPVRRALSTQRFMPAIRQGKAVQQVVQLPFVFVPDSTSKRRRR